MDDGGSASAYGLLDEQMSVRMKTCQGNEQVAGFDKPRIVLDAGDAYAGISGNLESGFRRKDLFQTFDYFHPLYSLFLNIRLFWRAVSSEKSVLLTF